MADDSQFDSLAELYVDFSELPFRRYLEVPSVLDLVGPTDGLKILDYGCGSGVYARMLARSGTASVVGLDESAGMLEYAKRREAKERSGIKYFCGKLSTQLRESFDLVLAHYILPYAHDYCELVAICQSAADALRPGQRLATSVVSPTLHSDPEYYSRYGFRITVPGPLADGLPLGLNLRFGAHDEYVTGYYWTPATVEKALIEAGFINITWHHYRPIETNDIDAAFLQPYLDAPHSVGIEAIKAPRPASPVCERVYTPKITPTAAIAEVTDGMVETQARVRPPVTPAPIHSPHVLRADSVVLVAGSSRKSVKGDVIAWNPFVQFLGRFGWLGGLLEWFGWRRSVAR
ncbi:S-adenosyl-L-methionine-dependent methyltransferase [Hypoxylon sp. NC1633]|nr:S-adenosyl-L-methionine-dependent methyltransferase [Hypoxylon sp. NC1633]